MKNNFLKHILIFVSVLLALFASLFAYLYYDKKTENDILKENIGFLQKSVENLNKTLKAKNEEIKRKDELIEAHKMLIKSLRENSEELEKKYTSMLRAVDEAAKSVENFKKYAEADKMLLAKYSKVFFLNEHYVPKNLSYIDQSYTSGKILQFKQEAMPFLNQMLQDMKKAGLKPQIVSAYRSFEQQKHLKGIYTSRFGKGANAFSADQGYSEHQLGTTIDISKEGLGLKVSFENTEEFKWLKENAWKYGFILSYPKNNKYYIYEPWHWRFVGKQLAKKLHDENKYFYELSQNEIYKYLINMFDK